MVFLLQW
jgi:hypothetical protein